MKPKYSALSALKILIIFCIFYWLAKPVLAIEYQNCSTSANCTIGEFLFDDTYAPDATASCTITSRNPNGSLFLNSAAMTASSSGWYLYTATIGTTEGVYPSQVCCTTTNSNYLCLDKTFKVVAPTAAGATAAEIWSYSSRSLTSFGTLVSDIWNYSSRSLSSFGDLVSNIWSKDARTLTSIDTVNGPTITTNITEIKKTVKENRIFLEQLINKPIVKTFIDDTSIPNLSDKLEQAKIAAANIYSGVQNLKSRSLLLKEKWPTLTESEIKSELNTLSSIFKQDINQKDTNILATTNWLKTSWNSPVLLNLADQTQAAKSQIENLLSDINLYGKNLKSDSITIVLNHIQQLDNLVGSSLATETDLSLYGFVKKISGQIAFLDIQTAEATKILTEIKKDNTVDQSAAIAKLSSDILTSNQLPQVDSFFIKSIKNTDTPTNKVLALLAIVDTNRLLLASNTGKTINNIWLEEGSIIFRSVATNPSHTLTQSVAVKYFLPTEIKMEQIISHDPELEIIYDPVENVLFASGEITLAPDETRTFLVEVEDIWSFRQEEIDSLKIQVNDLASVLKNTSFFAQATSIKSDVIVTLDKIMLRQSQAVTPESRIRTYRESALEMTGAEEKITSLKDLVVESHATGGFLGYVGGIQTVSLWGIVLIVIAGFVFLTLYFNTLRDEDKLKRRASDIVEPKSITAIEEEHREIDSPASLYHHRQSDNRLKYNIPGIVSILLLVSGLGSIGASLAYKANQDRLVSLAYPSPNAAVLGTSDDKLSQKIDLKVFDSGNIPVRNSPSITSPEIMSLNRDIKTVFVFRFNDNWAQIGLSDQDTDKGWWINTQYLEFK